MYIRVAFPWRVERFYTLNVCIVLAAETLRAPASACGASCRYETLKSILRIRSERVTFVTFAPLPCFLGVMEITANRRRRASAAVAYVLWLAATWRDQHKLAKWGPDWLRWAVQRLWFDQVWRLAGVTSALRTGDHDLSRMAPCVVTVSPHGAFALGFVGFHATTLREHPVAQLRAVPVGASVLFRIPLLRELLLLLGCREATPQMCDSLLESGKRASEPPSNSRPQHRAVPRAAKAAHLTLAFAGRSVALNPGGVWEQLHTTHKEEALHLQPGSESATVGSSHG